MWCGTCSLSHIPCSLRCRNDWTDEDWIARLPCKVDKKQGKMNSYPISRPQLLLVHSQMNAACLPCKLCKNKEKWTAIDLPKNCLATAVASVLTATQLFFFKLAPQQVEKIVRKAHTARTSIVEATQYKQAVRLQCSYMHSRAIQSKQAPFIAILSKLGKRRHVYMYA